MKLPEETWDILEIEADAGNPQAQRYLINEREKQCRKMEK